jgi:DNA-3-methyladenine glycosylase II
VARTVRIPCPAGFEFRATAETLRRGPADPLNWFDGLRWRRFFAEESAPLLLEASWTGDSPAGAARPYPADPSSLTVRTLAGSAPARTVERIVTRVFGLDDPGNALLPHLPRALRPLIARSAGVLLPGHPTLFEALVQTVLGQQLNTHVANRQRAAFIRAFGKRHASRGRAYWAFPHPRRVAGLRARQIRGLGISWAKARALREIASSLADGGVSEQRLTALSSAEAIDALTTLPGVGRWTGEWVLLRALRRFDVVPAGDLAVRKAIAWARDSSELPTEHQVRDIAAAWFPYEGLVTFRLLVAHRQTIG